MQRKIVIICGPTASGKSARALEMARQQNGVLINADAMQLYKELHILTARPTKEEEAQAPHALYGILQGNDPGSAGRWLGIAAEAIDRAWSQGQQPIVVGGTGLYIKALMEGLSPIPEVPAEVRERVRTLASSWRAKQSNPGGAKNPDRIAVSPSAPRNDESLHAVLSFRDPEMAARLRPSDTQRILRALEVVEATGKSLAWWQAQPRQAPFPNVEFEIATLEVPRGELYRRCDARFLNMMENGALEEVRALLGLGYDTRLPIMRVVGVPEMAAYLRGDTTLDEAIAKAQQATRRYAKRQMTWIRNQMQHR